MEEQSVTNHDNQLSKIKQTIWDFGKDNPAFQNNTFPELCFKISCVVEQAFLVILNPVSILKSRFNLGSQQDEIRHSYREILKWAYRFSDMTDSFAFPQVTESDTKAMMDLMINAKDFNPIRKAFDDFDLARYSVEVKSEKEIVFTQKQAKRDLGASIYARWVDQEKPEGQINSEKNAAMNETARLLSDPTLGETWDLYKNKPAGGSCFQKYYQSCYQKVLSDAEEKNDYLLDGYTLEHFRMVYAALMALGLMRFHEIFRNQLPIKKADNYDSKRPIVFGTMKWLQSYLSRTLKLEETEVQQIISDLTYDAEFHKNRITIIQPLFAFDKYFFFSPTIVYLSMQQDKLFFLYKEKRKAPKLISKIAKDREMIMTEQLKSIITSHSDLKCSSNHKIVESGITKAEFDLLIFDPKNNKLLLTELKWFYKADGEYGHSIIDQKIQDSIRSRQEREQTAQKHLKEITTELFGCSQTSRQPEIMSCIVSRNYSGSSFLDDQLPVFDQFLFLQELEKCKYDLSAFFDDIKTGNYLPKMKDLNLKMGHYPIEYAEIKVWIPCYENAPAEEPFTN